MSPLDIPGLLRALADDDVDYVLIGAAALAAHGPVRATEDVDIVPDPDPENLAVAGDEGSGRTVQIGHPPIFLDGSAGHAQVLTAAAEIREELGTTRISRPPQRSGQELVVAGDTVTRVISPELIEEVAGHERRLVMDAVPAQRRE